MNHDPAGQCPLMVRPPPAARWRSLRFTAGERPGEPGARHHTARGCGRLLLLLLLLAAGLDTRAAALRLAGATMGTRYSLSVLNPTRPAREIQAGVDALLEDINSAMSTWQPTSELSRLNQTRQAGWLAISPALHQVLVAAAEVSGQTGGAFDVTVGPVVNLWGFGPQPRVPVPPPADALAAAQARVGYRQLQLLDEPPRARKVRPDLYVDLSAIAKGYAVDRVATWLTETGHTDFMVEIGGEIVSRGHGEAGRPWQIGVAWPERDSTGVERVLLLGDTALATSGDYQRYFEFEGKRYAHEIDPATGRPIEHALAAVTVLHASCMYADAYATGLLVLGPTRGPALARELGLAALFLIREGTSFRAVTTGEFPKAKR